MKVKFWGTRGSIPTPLLTDEVRDKVTQVLKQVSPKDIVDDDAIERFIDTLPRSLRGGFGGNTTCIEVRSQNNNLIIIDAGTGIRPLGNSIMGEGFAKGDGEAHILFTHTHWVLIPGLPFFVPFYIEGNIFHIHAIHENIERRLSYQHHNYFFPVSFDSMPCIRNYYQHEPDDVWEIHNIEISAKALNHPGIAYAYKMKEIGGNNKTFIFASDAEFHIDGSAKADLEEFFDFFLDADVLVFDAQYTFSDQLKKIDWGHSSASIAIDIAIQCRVKKLLLFHYDSSYSDAKINQCHFETLQYLDIVRPKMQVPLEVIMSYDTLELEI